MVIRVDRGEVGQQRRQIVALRRTGRHDQIAQVEQVQQRGAEPSREQIALVVLLTMTVEGVDVVDIALELEWVVALDVLKSEPASPVVHEEPVGRPPPMVAVGLGGTFAFGGDVGKERGVITSVATGNLPRCFGRGRLPRRSGRENRRRRRKPPSERALGSELRDPEPAASTRPAGSQAMTAANVMGIAMLARRREVRLLWRR